MVIGMFFGATVVILVDLASALLPVVLRAPTCSYTETIGINNVISFTNPNWPGTYKPRESCRWDFKCHEGYVCHLRCPDVGLPQSKGCFMDKLLVSPTGDRLFRDARKYCGRRRINVRSSGTRISMVLATSDSTPGGRFRCRVKTDQPRRLRHRQGRNASLDTDTPSIDTMIFYKTA